MAKEYYLLFWDAVVAMPVRCSSEQLPTLPLLWETIWSEDGCDLSITPLEFAWTLVRTHEDVVYFTFEKQSSLSKPCCS
jgi:hypothetical protein